MFHLPLFGFVPPTFWSVLVLILLILTVPHGVSQAHGPRGYDAALGRAHRMRLRRRGGWLWRVPTAA